MSDGLYRLPQSYWWYFSLQVTMAGMEMGLAHWPLADGAHSGTTAYPHHFVPANDPHWETVS